jgi:hypothetical protein
MVPGMCAAQVFGSIDPNQNQQNQNHGQYQYQQGQPNPNLNNNRRCPQIRSHISIILTRT